MHPPVLIAASDKTVGLQAGGLIGKPDGRLVGIVAHAAQLLELHTGVEDNEALVGFPDFHFELGYLT